MKGKEISHFIVVATTFCRLLIALERGIVVIHSSFLFPRTRRPITSTAIDNNKKPSIILGIVSGRVPPSSSRLFGSTTPTTQKKDAEDNDGSSSSTRSSRSRRRKKDQRWITCSSTNELVAAVKHFVKPGYKVAELGAQLREVSTAICKSSSASSSGNATTTDDIVLVDVTRKFPKNREHRRTKAMRRPGDERNFFSDVATFLEIDTLDDWRKAFMNASNSDNYYYYDVFVLDLNPIVGNDLEWTSLSIVREFVALFEDCNVVLIKSVSLNQWAARLIHGQKWVTAQQQMRVPNHDRDSLLPSTPHIVATVGVQEYRSTIPYCVQPGDAVLEVGCHFGTTTDILNKAAATPSTTISGAPPSEPSSFSHCIGVDVGPRIIQGAKERYPHIYFAVGDAWKTACLLRIQQDFLQTQQQQNSNNNHKDKQQQHRHIGFDVIYVDVGGLSSSDGLIEALTLLSSLMYALEPRCIVIKSLCVRRLASALTPAWHILGL